MFGKDLLYRILVLLLISVFHCGATKPRASYIKPCSKSAADFDECCLKHGKEAIPYMLKGDKDYNVPNLTPFFLPSISMTSSNDLKVSVEDIYIHGLDNNDLKQVKFDLQNKKVISKFVFHKINIIGECNLDGKFIMIPIQSSGKCNFTIVEIDVLYIIDYKMDIKDGDEYFAVDKASCDYTCQRVLIDIENIFGDKQITETTNKALNDNWQEFAESFKPMIAETIVKIGNLVINGFAGVVPFREVFLD